MYLNCFNKTINGFKQGTYLNFTNLLFYSSFIVLAKFLNITLEITTKLIYLKMGHGKVQYSS